LADVQGNILKSFGKPNMWLLYFRFDDARIRDWLRDLTQRNPKIIPSTLDLLDASNEIKRKRETNPDFEPSETWLHISLSYSGITTLGLSAPPSTQNRNRADPFEMGMKHRAVLEDLGPSAPEGWIEPFKLKTSNGNDVSTKIDALFIVASDKTADGQKEVDKLKKEARLRGVVSLREPQRGKAIIRKKHQIEHFGFHDGISQPLIRGVDDAHIAELKTYTQNVLAPEDFVLSGLTGSVQWANNGSFLVYRRLRQDVHDFWDFMDSKSRELSIGKEELAAKFFGRWKSGGSLAKHSAGDPGNYSSADNDFLYERNDPQGLHTPKFSHIRKVNPRDTDDDTNSHRILRRGIPYGPWWKKGVRADRNEDRGLLFICYQRDIAQQFEYLQSKWASRETFPHDPRDLVRPGPDPIAGQHYEQKGPVNLVRAGGSEKLGIKQWVTTTGGGYFFSPSISFLEGNT
jgi:Dyp-type peroxidase family